MKKILLGLLCLSTIVSTYSQSDSTIIKANKGYKLGIVLGVSSENFNELNGYESDSFVVNNGSRVIGNLFGFSLEHQIITKLYLRIEPRINLKRAISTSFFDEGSETFMEQSDGVSQNEIQIPLLFKIKPLRNSTLNPLLIGGFVSNIKLGDGNQFFIPYSPRISYALEYGLGIQLNLNSSNIGLNLKMTTPLNNVKGLIGGANSVINYKLPNTFMISINFESKEFMLFSRKNNLKKYKEIQPITSLY